MGAGSAWAAPTVAEWARAAMSGAAPSEAKATAARGSSVGGGSVTGRATAWIGCVLLTANGSGALGAGQGPAMGWRARRITTAATSGSTTISKRRSVPDTLLWAMYMSSDPETLSCPMGYK